MSFPECLAEVLRLIYRPLPSRTASPSSMRRLLCPSLWKDRATGDLPGPDTQRDERKGDAGLLVRRAEMGVPSQLGAAGGSPAFLSEPPEERPCHRWAGHDLFWRAAGLELR